MILDEPNLDWNTKLLRLKVHTIYIYIYIYILRLESTCGKLHNEKLYFHISCYSASILYYYVVGKIHSPKPRGNIGEFIYDIDGCMLANIPCNNVQLVIGWRCNILFLSFLSNHNLCKTKAIPSKYAYHSPGNMIFSV